MNPEFPKTETVACQFIPVPYMLNDLNFVRMITQVFV